MSLTLNREAATTAPFIQLRPESSGASDAQLPMQVIRRNGTVSKFDAGKISVAMTKAFLAVEGHTAAASRRVHEVVEQLTAEVVGALTRRMSEGRTFHIEDVQDQVELALMRSEHHKVARAYVLYRDERTRQRAELEAARPSAASSEPAMHVTLANGTKVPLDHARLQLIVEEACAGLDGVEAAPVLSEIHRNVYDGISQDELALASVMAARTLVEQEPNYAYASARLLLDKLRTEVLSFVEGMPINASQADMATRYADYFPAYIKTGIKAELLDPDLARYDIKRLAAALKPERDLAFQFLGLQTLYDRYFLHADGNRIELPQAFFMRVAMGLAAREIDREARAIEFYDLLSSFDFMASTPTLFNSGNAAAAAVVVLPHHRGRRSRRHLQIGQGQRAAGKVFRRARQRLDPRPRPRRAHQGHQWREPGRGAVPEGRQRHRDRRQPGRQAQGRGLRLPRDLAYRHRGIPRPAQEHRRRPPPHPRHEHRQLGARSVHAARRGGRRMDAVLAGRGARSARSLRQAVRRALCGL